jgi:multicomponent Na+:H+ antiporter subunit D
VFLHAGIKFPWFVFFQKDSGLRPPDPPVNMRAAMLFFAALCLLLGVAPGLLYVHLPYASQFVPYTGDHVVSQLQLLLFSGLAFFLLLGWLRRTTTITLDTDWFYRRLGPEVLRAAVPAIAGSWSRMSAAASGAILGLLAGLGRAFQEGYFAREHASGTMALIAICGVALYLAIHIAFF